MARAKYFEGIRKAQEEDAAGGDGGPPIPFSIDALRPDSWRARVTGRLTQAAIPYVYALARQYRPVLDLAGLVHVTRAEQVRDVLARPQDFIVPFEPEMKELGGGSTFLLGLDGQDHDRLHAILTRVLLPGDVARIGAMAEQFSDGILDNARGEIDVIADLLRRVPTEICLRYFGLSCPDPDLFADWTLAISALLFGDPYGDPVTRRLAKHAQVRLTAVIEEAIARHRQVLSHGSPRLEARTTLVERFLLVQREDPSLTDGDIRAMLLGLAAGFVPTNTLAGAKMLEELLDRPEALEMAQAAARSGDAEAMRRIVLEAGRLNPALAPGQWRYCPKEATLSVDGKPRVIPAGSTLLVSTQSAMRDPREWDRPNAFRIDRVRADGSYQEPDLMFGIGSHRCLGEHHAVAQIAGCFTALLRRERVARARWSMGRVKYAGPFPRNLVLTYSAPDTKQSMFLVIAPVTDGASKEQVEETISALGHPAQAGIRAALDRTNVVHFASLVALESERGLDVVFELSCDGDIPGALARIEEEAGDLLHPVFAHCGLRHDERLRIFLGAHVVTLHGKLWGATGLDFNGLGEFPVERTARQARFADFAGRTLRDYVATETARGSHPTLTLNHLRRILRGDPVLRAEATDAQKQLMDEAQREGWDAFHLGTDRMRLQLAKFRQIKGWRAILWRFLGTGDGLSVWFPVLAVVLLATAVIRSALGEGIALPWLVAPLLGIIAGLLLVAAIAGLFVWRLRVLETSEVPSTERASMDHLKALAAAEDHPGYAQNHVLAVGRLKKGAFRTFLHALALWGIRMIITHGIRPGFVWNMGTIHYARWWRLPGTRVVAFYSNFDGSWENYLEDFIVRASEGQTAAWSNWEGFPKSRLMMLDGALDSDAFKQFTRTVQRAAPFWYARFPELTSDQIRNNGQIHVGAALGRTATEAEEWVRCFSSMPRTANMVETDEVQALVFRGMKRLPYSVALVAKLPGDPVSLGNWLCWVRGRPMQVGAVQAGAGGDADEVLEELLKHEVITPVPRAGGRRTEYALAHSLSITFGDRPLMGFDAWSDKARKEEGEDKRSDADRAMGQAVFLGLTAAGLAKFDAPNMPAGSAWDGLPGAFRMGMAARHRINGDRGADSPEHWRWHDDPSGDDPAEATLMLYAATPEALQRMVTIHAGLLENHGGAVLHRTDCAPVSDHPDRTDFEHFGFRDGISQPVMRGTTRSVRNVPERDIVEPGEFVIGYPNDSGYMPESPHLPADADIACALPVVIGDNLSRYTDFGDGSLANAPRDFGRNGTFLVIRELAQDVDGFEKGAETAAGQLSEGALGDLYKLVGQMPDAEWVKAKMMGRWPDGRPLIGNPVRREGDQVSPERWAENDFSYALDDPQGLACPFAAHIRRTNPRDSKHPDDPHEQAISNRHRLLRRGRPYTRADGEKGLLFACFCTDIERQFEFVQQHWADAPAFHGLDNEPDPIIGADPVAVRDGETRERGFTIPTAAGPVRLGGLQKYVTMKGGGYFFMPSRSALGWLADISLRKGNIFRSDPSR